MTTTTIRLGAEVIEAKPMFLRTFIELSAIINAPVPNDLDGLLRRSAAIVAAGLRRSRPELTAEAILELEITPDDLGVAVDDVLRCAGFAVPARPGAEEPAPVAAEPALIAPRADALELW